MTQPPSPALKQAFTPTPEAIQAVLAALVMAQGEPLVDPVRIVLSIARPRIEAAAGRHLVFDYVQDDMNPFGRLDIIVEG